MGVILDDLYDHEGYGARRLPDGTVTGTWSAETAIFEAYIASCGCGWYGGDHPPTEDGYEAAVEEWESSHARPLYLRTVPDDVRSSIRTVKESVSELVGERPLAGLEALRALATWASATVDRLQTSLGSSTTPSSHPGGPRPARRSACSYPGPATGHRSASPTSRPRTSERGTRQGAHREERQRPVATVSARPCLELLRERLSGRFVLPMVSP